MKRGIKQMATMAALCLAAVLSIAGCGGAQTEQPSASPSSTQQATPSPSPTPEEITLSQTYTTKFGEKNAITYPAFTFDYPDNWKVEEEDVTQQTERVVLTNENGQQIVFAYYGYAKDYNFGGSSTLMKRVEVSKAADSQFVPGYVQATDYADLGTFMVAKLKVTGTLDMQNDEDFTDTDGSVSYAVLPESQAGTRDDVRATTDAEFNFWYAGFVSLSCTPGDQPLTEQEEREVIAILQSFRVQEDQ